ncbi:MAG: DUF1080 domain-containing protein [Saprospiraceae bacterium]
MKNLIVIFACLFLLFGCESSDKQVDTSSVEGWSQLFNGKNMEGWTPKLAGYKVGDNFNNTFRVTDGNLQANYSEYDTFRNEFGHLFYQEKYSHYRLRAEYRAVGKQMNGGAGWAVANNGLMLHCQSPESMTLDQGFPLSIEFQLLAGNGKDERPTGNLCTPGSHVTMKGELFEPHCVNSNSKTYHGEQWVTAEAIVYGDSIIHHVIEGDTVMTYSKPVIGGGEKGLDTLKFPEGKRMTEGYISIQAESQSFDFRKIEILDLCGCMDKKAVNYKSYFVCSEPKSCVYE